MRGDQSRNACSRNEFSIFARMRETCIWETPRYSAIWTWCLGLVEPHDQHLAILLGQCGDQGFHREAVLGQCGIPALLSSSDCGALSASSWEASLIEEAW
jgi:hypothetical protein